MRVVRQGFLERKGAVIERSSSTVSLVELGGHRVVVDTGARDRSDEIVRSFEEMRVPLESVEAVVNTHLHSDHVGGNDLFPHARVYAHALEDPPVGTMRVTGETVLYPGVSLVPTPGHTKGSVSVFVDGRRRYVIAGDALPTRGNFENHTPPSMHFDRALAVASMDVILAWAEIVVPGHDALFEVMRRGNKA